MKVLTKRVMVGMLCAVACLCVSCLSMTLPQGTTAENPSPQPPPKEYVAADTRLCDTWELLYMVDDKGNEEKPKEGTRVLIEFTQNGRLITNRIDGTASEQVRTKTGTYVAENNHINITDDKGNQTKWPYMIDGDTLITEMPEKRSKLYWRRFR